MPIKFLPTSQSQTPIGAAIQNFGSALFSGPTAAETALANAKLKALQSETEKEERLNRGRQGLANIIRGMEGGKPVDAIEAAATAAQYGLKPGEMTRLIRSVYANANANGNPVYGDPILGRAIVADGQLLGKGAGVSIRDREGIRIADADLARRNALAVTGAGNAAALERQRDAQRYALSPEKFDYDSRLYGTKKALDLTYRAPSTVETPESRQRRAIEMEGIRQKNRLELLENKPKGITRIPIPKLEEIKTLLKGSLGVVDDIDDDIAYEVAIEAAKRSSETGRAMILTIDEIAREMLRDGRLIHNPSNWSHDLQRGKTPAIKAMPKGGPRRQSAGGLTPAQQQRLDELRRKQGAVR